MFDPGSTASPPAQYRIALAVSLALLVHTLVLSALPLLFERSEQVNSTLTVELVSPGQRPAPQTPADAGPQSEPPPERNPEFDIAPRPATVPAPTSARASKPDTASPAPVPPAPSPPTPSTQQPTAQAPNSTASARNSAPATAGVPTTPETEAAPADITRITRSPAETDDYIVSLATRIAGELKRSRIRAVHALTQPVAMEVELQLMQSGVLTRARVIRSSGVDEIDAAAYRAALAASPYQQVPDNEERTRFRVELVFSPERKAGS